jgi:phosphocarrier protein FPr
MPTLTLDRIALGANAENRYQAIRMAGALLVKSGCVMPEYVEGMLERELSMSTCPGDYPVAIPHGLPGNAGHVLKTGISVLQLKEPVGWGPEGLVSVVIGIAAKGEEHLRVMENLGDLLESPEKLQELVGTSDPAWVLDCLGGSEAPAAEIAPPEPEPAGGSMLQAELVVENPTGLHLRPATVLAELAGKFRSDVRILFGAKRANAKSVPSIMKLGATRGSRVVLQVAGEDEAEALDRIREAILAGLGDTLAPETSAGTSPAGAVPAAPAPAGTVSAPPAEALVPVPATPGLLRGVAAAPGMAVGPAFPYRIEDPDLDRLEAGPRVELLGLDAALAEARVQLDQLHRQMTERKLASEAAIFKAHAMLLADPELLEGVLARIQAGQWVPRAWQAGIDELAGELAALEDPTLAARADDLRDAGRRVLRLMLKLDEHEITLPETPVVVLARELSPSATAAFDPKRVLGFCIVNGGPTSHIAILARALGLPAVVAAPEALLAVPAGTLVVLDGNAGSLAVDPDPEALERARQAQLRAQEARRQAQEQAALPAVTLDGHRVDVTANIGSLANAVAAVKNHADGSGLLRTEFLFLDRATAPSEEEQYEVYRGIAEAMGTRPVIVRTLDIGGDKPVPYIQMKPEENPFLGERGIRLCLNQPALFRDQLRAILRAAPAGCLRIMFPMVSDLGEIRQARALVEALRQELGLPPVQVGIMVEVPSAALLADKLAPEVDFFSIGTNDLTQYTLAIDRGHPSLAARHDGMHPSVLRLIAMTAEASHRHGKRTDVCGELGSDPAAIPILIGLGVDELSVSIPAVPAVKAQVRSLDLAGLRPLAQRALECATAQEVRELVKLSTI